MIDTKSTLLKIFGTSNITDDPEMLNRYSRDESFVHPLRPWSIVQPKNISQVQELVRWANETSTPLVPVSSGPPHFHGDTVPGALGALIVDLSGMKKILGINRRNQVAIIEPGVTYREMQLALAKEGLRLSTSLLPRANKSVLASLLEREPRLIPRNQWSSMDPLRCLEMVWGDGKRVWSGFAGTGPVNSQKQASQNKYPLDLSSLGQTDFYRFLASAQGSMGIVTWASVRCEVLPQLHKLFFVTATKLNALFDFMYWILKFRYANELFLMNNINLSYVLGESRDQIKALKDKFPPWIILISIADRTELPAEKAELQEKDIRDIARQSGLSLRSDIAGIPGASVLETIMKPSREPYWKLNYKGGCQDIFFITPLNRTPEFVKTIAAVSEGIGYPYTDIGVYIQPRHQGVNCHCEFNIPFNPNSPEETARVQSLYSRASDALNHQGAFFTRPYGIWSDMAFNRDPHSATLLKNVKKILDPKGIMNPGKLCF